MKMDLAEEERIKQLKTGSKGPTQGFYTCKAAKNPSLFESKLYER